jgi:hypothetical protein
MAVQLWEPQCVQARTGRFRTERTKSEKDITHFWAAARPSRRRAPGAAWRRPCLLRPGKAGRPSLEHPRTPSAPTAVSCRTQVQPELHPRPRCGGGRGEPQPAAGEGLTPRMRFPPHESWADAPRGPHEDERNLRRTRGDRPAPRGPRIRRPVRAPDPPTPNAAAMKASGPASLAPPPRRRRTQPSRLCLLEAAGGEQGRLKYVRPRREM